MIKQTFKTPKTLKTLKTLRTLRTFRTLRTLSVLFFVFLSITNANSNPFGLVELQPKEGLIINLQYKTKNNITGKPLYPKDAKAYLHPLALERLNKAIKLLRPQGYGIVLLDAWRPYISGARLWNKAHELGLQDYYCPPLDGGHTRAVAIDVSLYKLRDPKTKVIMPSEFDEPIRKCPPNPHALQNANVLKNTMNKAGFVGHKREWWHFNLPNLNDFPLIEESIKGKLPRMNF